MSAKPSWTKCVAQAVPRTARARRMRRLCHKRYEGTRAAPFRREVNPRGSPYGVHEWSGLTSLRLLASEGHAGARRSRHQRLLLVVQVAVDQSHSAAALDDAAGGRELAGPDGLEE